jgi:hypothetical protein
LRWESIPVSFLFLITATQWKMRIVVWLRAKLKEMANRGFLGRGEVGRELLLLLWILSFISFIYYCWEIIKNN